jgi:predicted metal-dependent HD superfamily phosphohydrolase
MLPAQLIRRIRRLHDDPRRSYHAWSHPQALLELLAEVRSQLSDPLAVECAILLHDAVYDPERADNERRSAALARELLTGVVPTASLVRAVRLIEATERHQIPDDTPEREAGDMRVFLDMDLSVLATADDAFDAYEAGVRHEYDHVPEADFRQGRAAVLSGFLAREQLYLSDWGRARFETRARANLQRSLAALGAP